MVAGALNHYYILLIQSLWHKCERSRSSLPDFVHCSKYNLIYTSYLLIKICCFKFFNGCCWCQLLIFFNRFLENLFYYQADHCDTRNDCYSQNTNNSNEAFTNFKIFSPKSFTILENIPTYYTSYYMIHI